MSGFAGVFHFDGAPVERAWLEIMADFLSFRGPDAQQVWIAGNAGLCHTLLRTRAEHDGRPHVASLDGRIWITGDARIDAREDLIAKFPPEWGGPPGLRRAPRPASNGEEAPTSLDLILHAYTQWGEACVDHLLGDFSFVIWDAPRQRVFAARDQLGVKPLFYARIGQCLLVSNTLDCIRQIPIVSKELNEQAIGDYLIAGQNFNPTTTFFAGIQKLPVAQRLMASADGLRIERYWTMPIDEPVYYQHTNDYTDRFRELLFSAVRDRLPDGPLGILMSGGLDSPAVAAAAVQLGAKATAFTSVYDRLIPDRERFYSGLVAKHLGIPISYNVRDDEPWGWEPGAVPIHTPEPTGDPLSLFAVQQYYREISAQARVLFLGDGPDAALMNEWQPYLAWLVRKRNWGRLCRDLPAHFFADPRVPFLNMLRRKWRERKSQQADWCRPLLTVPAWIDPEFASRLKLAERLQEIRTEPPVPHPLRPLGYANFVTEFPLCGGANHIGFVGTEIEQTHPLGDLRMVRFLLSVPAIPWCRAKHLVRDALRGLIPEPVRRRPKAPLAGHPYLIRARGSQKPQLPACSELNRYVNFGRLPAWPGRDRAEFDSSLPVLDLHYWLLML